MNTRHRFTYLLSAVVLTLSAFGCSVDSQQPVPTALAVPMGGSDLTAKDGSSLIGPAGGCVAKGGVVVEVPPGALAVETRIGIILGVDGSVDLIPDGLRFAVPASLHLQVPSGEVPDGCVIQWYDPSHLTWVTITSSPELGARVAPLQHFSVYRLISTVQ